MTPPPSSSGVYRGAQVGATMGSNTGMGSSMGSNVNWGSADWDDHDGDAPTVAELPMDDVYGAYAGRQSYGGQGGYAGSRGRTRARIPHGLCGSW